eukprot:TRINITY_DN63999_c0_g1_i1.p1 TRINITY_DN63999_c0_g1~~TRINITY_DN63999_c0_g1_i1.p1  ORF type:complete len:274 (+),score=26.95 TRINITY_DN63999_c0_g1_i1:148-969(+)
MHQIGAALTDWGVSRACLVSLLVMYSRCRSRPTTPFWYYCFMSVYVMEGLACFGGGFMWSSGVNKHATHVGSLTAPQHVVCAIMMMGMVAEGLCLIMTSRELCRTTGKDSFISVLTPEGSALGVICIVYGLGCVANMSITMTYQLLAILAVGLAAMAAACFNEASRAADSSERACLWQLFGGQSVNLVGAAVLGLLDNKCTGVGCLTEPLPWEKSPCAFGTATPVGSTCPLPEWFNHAAVMHSLAIVSCTICVPALYTLLEIGWEPSARKKKH